MRQRAHFALVGDLLAYTAGGGVVVCQLDAKAKVTSQTIFVANSITEASASAFTAIPFESQWDQEQKKDEYGFPVNGNPVIHDGSANDSAETAKTRASGFDCLDQSAHLSPAKIKDKVKAVSCLAVSPNKRLLAVGETGYRPRILLYSLAPDAGSLPFAIIHEHRFGVKHLAFSPDLRHLCSLGNISDGFLHVWKVLPNSVTLKAGNKCSSVIHDLIWHDNGSEYGQIISLGLRFVKCWTYEPPDKSCSKTSILKGRPIVLGTFLDLDFKEGVSVNASEILLNDGQLIFVYATDGAGIIPVFEDRFGINGLLVDCERQRAYYFDDKSKMHLLDLRDLQPLSNVDFSNTSLRSPSKLGTNILNLSLSDVPVSHFVVKSCLFDEGKIIYATNQETITTYDIVSETSTSTIGAAARPLCGLKKSADGKTICHSKDGSIFLLTDDYFFTPIYTYGLKETDGYSNELTAVELFKGFLFTGDKYGQLVIHDKSETSWESVFQMKAHTSSINKLLCFEVEKFEILCSISRDRMIQLFICNEGEWSLLQTLPTHNGNLIDLKYSAPYLLVCSADRTISVHELTLTSDGVANLPISVIQKRIIMLKSSPLAMDHFDTELFVSVSDKSIIVYDLKSFEQKRIIKPYNDKTNDMVNAEYFISISKSVIAAACSDRSFRLFNSTSGRQLAAGWGHSESILGLLKKAGSILSLGSDGCLFEWKYDMNAPDLLLASSGSRSKNPTPEASPFNAKVTRKILPAVQTVTQTSPTRQMKYEEQIIPEPESPTPRLTSATLKRLEAKRKIGIISSSPQKTTSGMSLSVSHKLAIASKTPGLKRSPVSKPSTSTFASPRVSSTDSPSPRRPLLASRIISPQRQPRSNSTPSLPPPSNSDSAYSLERSLAHLELIKCNAKNDLFSKADKERLKTEMESIIQLFAIGTRRSEAEILEDYSSRLIALVERKLHE